MQRFDFVVESNLKHTPRVRMLEGMFDVPAANKLTREWHGDVPIDDRDWNIGLIVGPSGAGKSTIARQMFGEPKRFRWNAGSVIDDFAERYSI